MVIARNRQVRNAIVRGFEAMVALWRYARSTVNDNPLDSGRPHGGVGCAVGERVP
jgi:hypothetical protein